MDKYSFGIKNLEHDCKIDGCLEKAITHFECTSDRKESGYFCSEHSKQLPFFKGR